MFSDAKREYGQDALSGAAGADIDCHPDHLCRVAIDAMVVNPIVPDHSTKYFDQKERCDPVLCDSTVAATFLGRYVSRPMLLLAGL